jgi:error-prone DNA polymerase
MGLSDDPMPLFDNPTDVPTSIVALPEIADDMEVVTDYATTGLSLKQHPVAFARKKLTRLGVISAADVQDAVRFPENQRVSVCGLVLVRQRPGTASGVVFITLEDETGIVNLIVWGTVYDRYRRAARHATLLQATGHVQRQGQVIHIVVRSMTDRTSLIGPVSQNSRDFH